MKESTILQDLIRYNTAEDAENKLAVEEIEEVLSWISPFSQNFNLVTLCLSKVVLPVRHPTNFDARNTIGIQKKY